MPDRVLSTPTRTGVAARPTRPEQERLSSSAAQILALQRSAGNAAVNAMLLQRAPATGTVALSAPVVTAENEEGSCGYFSRVREWAVANAQQGVIVQRVTRRFDVERFDGQGWQALNGAALDAYVAGSGGNADATVTEYWELWQVGADGTVSDGGADTFGLTSIIQQEGVIPDTTRGTFTITGEAQFYPTTDTPTNLGFVRGAVGTAGGLYSSFTAPTLTGGVSPVNYRVTASWDSTDKRAPSKRTGTEYRPRASWTIVTES
ncbi:hypothetical protein [Actinoplanes siamensis]|uniref:Uncharacterized protein n=1 Tax=Actinoplanes siamensis TaxID=1223317 RepID=A0A919NDA3_9ACTN|nr:hypothetical protein [Actinoplanes siamensis]GIF09073.1 hypothetical protein Asi03nite_66110 [Actinoplanes siamensis]